jgi:Amt family ammonium transporter
MSALVSMISASTAGLTWVFMDYYMGNGKMSGVSFCSGVLAGLVTITPGSGFVSPWASVIFGIVGAVCCNLAVRGKEYLGYDDARK